MSEQIPVNALHLNVLELMNKKVQGVHSSQAQKELVELGELLRYADLDTNCCREVIRKLVPMAMKLSPEGDERNAKAYLNGLIKDVEKRLAYLQDDSILAI